MDRIYCIFNFLNIHFDAQVDQGINRPTLAQWCRQEFLLGGGAKNVGVWGGARENFFSLTTPSTLAINVTNASFIG